MEATAHAGTPELSAATDASSDMPIEGSDPDEGMLCAICLDEVSTVNTAIIKGCEHTYCVNCILRWAGFKEPATCPQCKHPFSYLYVHLQLDGTLSERLLEESVVLLKRAPWFIDHIRVLEKDSGGSSSLLGADDYTQYDDDDDYNDDDDPYAEDEEMYLHRAGAGTRLLLGNRRWGENGRVRAGRMYARPVAPPPPAPTPSATSNRGTPASEKKAGKSAAAGRLAGPAVASGSGFSNSRFQPATSAAGSSNSSAVSAAGIGNGSNSATAGPACPATPAANAVPVALSPGAEAALAESTATGTVATPGARAATAVVAGSSAAAASAGGAAGGSSRKNQIGRPGTRNQAASNHAAAGPAANAYSSTGAAVGGSKGQGRRAKRHNRRAEADADDCDYCY